MRYDKNLSKYVPTHCIALSSFFKSDKKINNYLNLLSYPSSSIKKQLDLHSENRFVSELVPSLISTQTKILQQSVNNFNKINPFKHVTRAFRPGSTLNPHYSYRFLCCPQGVSPSKFKGLLIGQFLRASWNTGRCPSICLAPWCSNHNVTSTECVWQVSTPHCPPVRPSARPSVSRLRESTRAPGRHRQFFPDWPSDRKGYEEWRNQTRLDSPSAAMVPRGDRVEIAWSINSIRTIGLQHYVLTVFAWIYDGGHHIIPSQ